MPVETSKREAAPSAARLKAIWIAVTLAVVTVAVYWPVTGFQFVGFDDNYFVTENPHVRAGLTAASFKWAWGSAVEGNWHPITTLTHMLDCQLAGVKPWWPHLVNALLHAANTVLLFVLFKRMTGALWRSAIVAAFFALHPLHVESVAWVSERKDVLSTLFWFLAIWAYIRYADPPSPRLRRTGKFYGLSLLFFGIGLMSKPMLVTLPLALLLLDYWPLGRLKEGWRLVWEKIPFFALSAAMCVVTYRLQKQGVWMWGLQNFPIGQRLGNALVSYVRYIEMMFCPRHLAALYLNRLSPWPWWVVTLAAFLLLAVSGLVLKQARRRPYLAVGWLWYVGTLVPVIGLVTVGDQAVADRYTYVPLIGLFVIMVWGGWDLAGAGRLAGLAPAAAAAALAACAVLTVKQEYCWKDTETLFKRMIDVASNNYAAHFELGMFYLNANRKEEAIPQFMATAGERPDCVEAHNNLGGIFLEQRRYDESLDQYRTAVRLSPDSFQCGNLARALAAAGGARHDTNLLAEAAQMREEAQRLKLAKLEEGARLDPTSVEAWAKLGMYCASQNRMPEAERAYREMIRVQPNNGDTYRWLGNALGIQGKYSDAVTAFLTALKINPSDWEAECNLAQLLALQGKRGEAAEHYRQALRNNPNLPEAQKALSELERTPDPSQDGKQ